MREKGVFKQTGFSLLGTHRQPMLAVIIHVPSVNISFIIRFRKK